MPTYEYECVCCDRIFEAVQSIKADPWAACPTCLVTSKRRLISRTGFTLKGGGWASENYSKTS